VIKTIKLKNFTVFQDATIDFVPGVNVVVGENGAGKSHLLKLGYTCASVSHDWQAARSGSAPPTKVDLQKWLAEKLRNVFRPDSLGRLARRGSGRQRADVAVEFTGSSESKMEFSFATNSKSEVSLETTPTRGVAAEALFFPTKEVISLFPKFASLYRDYHIEIDETYYDLCLALERPLLKGRRYDHAKVLLDVLEDTLGGSVSNVNGRFVLSIPGEGNMEIPLVAEGIRKLATIAYLVANGTLRDKATLFWDEPETNLNPKLLTKLVDILVRIAEQGTQLILATHSLFLLKELDVRLRSSKASARFIALGFQDGTPGVAISTGNSVEEIEPIAALDAEIDLSSRYEDLLMDEEQQGANDDHSD
jgi:energy-coupling factor transporter ATP-binding protein EcfA2